MSHKNNLPKGWQILYTLCMKKNDEIKVQIESIGYTGSGVAHAEDRTIFVPYTLPGEVCLVKILKVTKSIAYAKVIDILTPSSERVTPPCPYYTKCGGCDLQHMSYDATLSLKSRMIQENFHRIAHIDIDVPKTIASQPYAYRNKITLPCDPKTHMVGMYRPSSHDIIPIEKCLIQDDVINRLLSIFNEYLKSGVSIYDEATGNGLVRAFVARHICDAVLVTVVINGNKLPDALALFDKISTICDKIGLYININKDKTNVVVGNKFIHVAGIDSIECDDNDIKYYVDGTSFFQVNDHIREALYAKVLSNIDRDDVVIDAYSGSGLLTAMIAKRARMAYGVEIVPQSVKNADNLAMSNNLSNMKNILGDCAHVIPNLVSSVQANCVVLDPPRKGCSRDMLDALIHALPDRIIYISCDHATLSRDYTILAPFYEISYIQPFDMFPETCHVETLTVLKRKEQQ